MVPTTPLPVPHLVEGDEVSDNVMCDDEPLQSLIDEKIRCVEYSGGQVIVDAPRSGRVYLPGSFNPLHEGHKQLLAAACAVAGPHAEGCFELSIGNADKVNLLWYAIGAILSLKGGKSIWAVCV